MSEHLRILIDGVDYVSYIDLDSLSCDNNVVMTSDTASCQILLTPEDVANQVIRPKAGMEFIWQTVDEHGVEVNREFGGVIVSVSEELDGVCLIYSLSIKSYSHWLDRHLVSAWLNQGSASDMIISLIQNYAQGFTVNHVQPTSAQVVSQYFNYQKLSDCISNISRQIGYGWYVDNYKDIHFYPFEGEPSPLRDNTLDVDNDKVSYGDLQLEENGEQVYNRIFIRGFKTRSTSPMTLYFVGDGNTGQWSLGYRASSLKNDVAAAVYPSVSAYVADTTFRNTGKVGTGSGGVQLTIKKDIIDGAPNQQSASNTAYIHYTEHLIRCANYNGTGNVIPTGYVLAVWFYYLRDQIFMGQDNQAQAEIASYESNPTYQSDGVYEFSQEDKSLTNSTMEAVKAKTELLIRKYARPQIRGRFTTFMNGWVAGQCFYLTSTKRLGGISSYMFVLRVNRRIVKSANGQYITQNEVEFAASPDVV